MLFKFFIVSVLDYQFGLPWYFFAIGIAAAAYDEYQKEKKQDGLYESLRNLIRGS